MELLTLVLGITLPLGVGLIMLIATVCLIWKIHSSKHELCQNK